MNQLTIVAKPKDSYRGIRTIGSKCVVALLLQEQHGFDYVSVVYSNVVVGTSKEVNNHKIYETSPELREAIEAYDYGQGFKPGIYVLTRL